MITISTNKLQGTVEVEEGVNTNKLQGDNEGVKLITTNKLQGDNEGVKLYQAMKSIIVYSTITINCCINSTINKRNN